MISVKWNNLEKILKFSIVIKIASRIRSFGRLGNNITFALIVSVTFLVNGDTHQDGPNVTDNNDSKQSLHETDEES